MEPPSPQDWINQLSAQQATLRISRQSSPTPQPPPPYKVPRICYSWTSYNIMFSWPNPLVFYKCIAIPMKKVGKKKRRYIHTHKKRWAGKQLFRYLLVAVHSFEDPTPRSRVWLRLSSFFHWLLFKFYSIRWN